MNQSQPTFVPVGEASQALARIVHLIERCDWGDTVQKSKADDSGGHWITIGGTRGSDGKRHGGSPVFIKNGRVERGHPSLIGRKLGGGKADTDHGTPRQQANRDRDYTIARLRKEANKLGHDPKALDDLAGDIRRHHDAFANERKDLLRHARQHAERNGYDSVRNIAARVSHGNFDHARLKGFDVVAESTQRAYPHHFHEEDGEHGSHADQLFEWLTSPDPKPMDAADAYEQALEHMRQHGPAKKQEERDPWDDYIPLALRAALVAKG